MQIHQLLADAYTGLERHLTFQQRNARQIVFEVLCVTFPVLWMVQQRVHIMEDIPLTDLGPIFGPELCQCPICNVLAPVRAIFCVSVVGECLHPCIAIYATFIVNNRVCCKESLMVCSNTVNTDCDILYLRLKGREKLRL